MEVLDPPSFSPSSGVVVVLSPGSFVVVVVSAGSFVVAVVSESSGTGALAGWPGEFSGDTPVDWVAS